LLGGGGDLLPQVAQAGLDGAEDLAAGGVGEGVGHLLQQGGGGRLQLRQEAPAPLVARFSPLRGRRRVHFGGG
jgi:hypothetical protein